MQPEQIMSSDLLDILFADRNKMYGAYTLRKEYNYRLKKALMITCALVCTALAFYFYFGESQNDAVRKIFIDLPPPVPAVLPVEPKLPEPPPAPRPKQQPVAAKQLTTPVIVVDASVKKPIPPIDQLANVQVGLEDRDGPPGTNSPPPIQNSTGTGTESPAGAIENDNSIRDKVDIESAYPGGPKAWKRFLIKTFRYPPEAEQNNIFGTVLIKFIVDKEGNVSGIQALSGPQELRAEAIRVISKSGKWTPAMQNGQVVNSYKYQQIVFQLSE